MGRQDSAPHSVLGDHLSVVGGARYKRGDEGEPPMPRIANETTAILADFRRRLERLVETARKEGREEALAVDFVKNCIAVRIRGLTPSDDRMVWRKFDDV